MQNENVRKRRILVMDDEEMIKLLLSRILKGDGYEVENAKDGAEAIEKYSDAIKARNPFDAVILDLSIPGGIGGKEVIKKLKTIDSKVKAIVSSGYSSDPIMANYEDYGFCAVAAKPYSIKEITETLRNLFMEKK